MLCFRYSILNPFLLYFRFTINEETGQVTVAQCSGTHGVDPCLDYDIPPKQYDVTVEATDSLGASTGLRNSALLTVRVTDVNDNSPRVPDYTRQILEDSVEFDPPLQVQVCW